MLEREKSKSILNLYKIKEELSKVTKKDNNVLNGVSKSLKSAFNDLENCILIETRANIEFILNNKTSYNAFLWQERLVATYQVFATMLGVIDARYDYIERSIKFHSEFTNTKEEIQEEKDKQEQLLVHRDKVLTDYLSVTSSDELNIVKEVLKEHPSYKAFNKLFEDMKENTYNFSLQGEVISSYMNGYNKSLHFYVEEIMKIYETLFSEFNKKIQKHNDNSENLKTLQNELENPDLGPTKK